MGEIIGFKKSSEYYLNLSEKRRGSGDFEGSVSALFYAKRFAENSDEEADVTLLLADAYSDIGKFDKANDLYFHLLMEGYYEDECYYSLAQNFVFIGRIDAAEHYFSLLQKKDSSLEEVSMEALFEQSEPESPKKRNREGYELVYPKESDVLDRAGELIEIGQFARAAEVLEAVDEKDLDYLAAKNELAFCYILLKEYEKSLECSETVLLLTPSNSVALCNKLLAVRAFDMPEVFEETLERIQNSEPDGLREKMRVATTMCEIGRHELAAKYLSIALEEKPYFDLLLILLGIAYANLGNLDEAGRVFARMLKVDEDSTVAKYYKRLIEKRKEEKALGREIFETLLYIPQIPYLDIATRMTKLSIVFESGSFGSKEEFDGELKEYIDWLFESGDISLQLKFLEALKKSDLVTKRGILRDIAISDRNASKVKVKSIEILLSLFVEDLQYVDSGKFFSIDVDYPANYFKMPKVFRDAFCVAFAVLCFLSRDKIEPLIEATGALFLIYSENKLDFRSKDALAVILISTSGYLSASAKLFSDTLGVNYATVKKYRELLFDDLPF